MDDVLSLEKLASLPEIHHPAVSPDGKKIVFYWNKTGRNEMYLMTLTNEKIKQLSEGGGGRKMHISL